MNNKRINLITVSILSIMISGYSYAAEKQLSTQEVVTNSSSNDKVINDSSVVSNANVLTSNFVNYEQEIGAYSEKNDLLNNKISILQKEENVIDAEIRILKKMNEKRVQEYTNNIDVSNFVDPKILKNDIKKDETKEVKPSLPTIVDPTLTSSVFDISSYSQDQIVSSIPKPVEEVVDDSILVVKNEKVEKNEKPNDEIKQNKNKEISDQDLKDLGMTREEYNDLLEKYDNHNKDTKLVNNEREAIKNADFSDKKVEPIFYIDIKDFYADSIAVFGKVKTADISLSLYVGDGTNGGNTEKVIKGIKEGDIIIHKGHEILVDSINKDYVELKILKSKDGRIFKSSKSK